MESHNKNGHGFWLDLDIVAKPSSGLQLPNMAVRFHISNRMKGLDSCDSFTRPLVPVSSDSSLAPSQSMSADWILTVSAAQVEDNVLIVRQSGQEHLVDCAMQTVMWIVPH